MDNGKVNLKNFVSLISVISITVLTIKFFKENPPKKRDIDIDWKRLRQLSGNEIMYDDMFMEENEKAYKDYHAFN